MVGYNWRTWPPLEETKLAEKDCFLLNVENIHLTCVLWNLIITVGVHSSLGYELDPVFDLGHPGIHPDTGALTSKTHHTNLGESK